VRNTHFLYVETVTILLHSVKFHVMYSCAYGVPVFIASLSVVYSDLDTLIHLLKGSLGSGILAMPMAFMNAGLAFGVVATFAIGFICTYCVHILVSVVWCSLYG